MRSISKFKSLYLFFLTRFAFVFLNNAGFPAAAKAITEEAKYELP
jgi:hypothetical protein